MTAIPPTHMLALSLASNRPANPINHVVSLSTQSTVSSSHLTTLAFLNSHRLCQSLFLKMRSKSRHAFISAISSHIPPPFNRHIFSQRTDLFIKSELPCPPPSTFQRDPSQVSGFARELAETFTTQAFVDGFWSVAKCVRVGCL
jgi:hypothetical protein